jgi:hypothetical protein
MIKHLCSTDDQKFRFLNSYSKQDLIEFIRTTITPIDLQSDILCNANDDIPKFTQGIITYMIELESKTSICDFFTVTKNEVDDESSKQLIIVKLKTPDKMKEFIFKKIECYYCNSFDSHEKLEFIKYLYNSDSTTTTTNTFLNYYKMHNNDQVDNFISRILDSITLPNIVEKTFCENYKLLIPFLKELNLKSKQYIFDVHNQGIDDSLFKNLQIIKLKEPAATNANITIQKYIDYINSNCIKEEPTALTDDKILQSKGDFFAVAAAVAANQKKEKKDETEEEQKVKTDDKILQSKGDFFAVAAAVAANQKKEKKDETEEKKKDETEEKKKNDTEEEKKNDTEEEKKNETEKPDTSSFLIHSSNSVTTITPQGIVYIYNKSKNKVFEYEGNIENRTNMREVKLSESGNSIMVFNENEFTEITKNNYKEYYQSKEDEDEDIDFNKMQAASVAVLKMFKSLNSSQE